MTKVFSSVKEAWNGIRSGAAIPTRSNARRRVSCTANIQAQAQAAHRSSPGQDLQDTSGTSRGTSLSANSSGNDDDEYFEYSVDVKLADEDDAAAAASDEVDVSVLSDEDLRKLKRDDPFLYYSIPSVRRLSYRFHDEDEINTSISANRRRRTSLPAALLAMADNRIDQSRQQQMQEEQEVPIMMQDPAPRRDSVVRRKRLSTEAHPTLVCDELMCELRELADSDSEEDDLGLLDLELDDF